MLPFYCSFTRFLPFRLTSLFFSIGPLPFLLLVLHPYFYWSFTHCHPYRLTSPFPWIYSNGVSIETQVLATYRTQVHNYIQNTRSTRNHIYNTGTTSTTTTVHNTRNTSPQLQPHTEHQSTTTATYRTQETQVPATHTEHQLHSFSHPHPSFTCD